jgi:hypothetical protein
MDGDCGLALSFAPKADIYSARGGVAASNAERVCVLELGSVGEVAP